MKQDFLVVKGAREKNLKNITVKIPKNQLVVFTGVSGSGKTSLAFSTIYNEGKRRYFESLSSYARQFLGNSEKPDVDQIDGLSPAIAIDQKTVSHNPRSIVGTVTEIYDYFRLLFARAGTPFCINGHGLIQTVTVQQMIFQLQQKIPTGTFIQIFSPVVTDKKGSFQTLLLKLKKEGFWTVLVDGQTYDFSSKIVLDKNQRHSISILVDEVNFSLDKDGQNHLYSSLETAVKYGNGTVMINFLLPEQKKQELVFSENFNCYQCGFGLKSLEPRLFSFNTVDGACSVCKGIGTVLDLDFDQLVPDSSLTINQGGIAFFKSLVNTQHRDWLGLRAMCHHFGIDLDKPVSQLNDQEWDLILNGSGVNITYFFHGKNDNKYKFNHPIAGVRTIIKKRFLETSSDSIHHKMTKKFLTSKVCSTCNGKRLNPVALSVQIQGCNIAQLISLTILQTAHFIDNLKLPPEKFKIVQLVLSEIKNRLKFLLSVGLDYLTLDRHAQSLSGGEAQRIRLATQIGSKLTGVLYVLDEPSIGLHQYDNAKLITTLKSMRNLGNTVLVVEHDEETILNADWVVDIGQWGGKYGGDLLVSGSVKQLINTPKSITGSFLAKKRKILVPQNRRAGNNKFLEVTGATENNLQNIDVQIPLGKMICITGVSGSGKSSLLNEVVYKGIKKQLDPFASDKPGSCKSINHHESIDQVVLISQEPIGKTPRSNPATYTSVFTDVRQLFANTIEANKRGYKVGRFSFNVYGGRCGKCEGDGFIHHSMLFLPDVYTKCQECQGKRYNEETLQIKYKGKSVADVLEMEIAQACEFFSKNPKIKRKLKTLVDIGLGYLKLGQPSPELSGGESQRIKLATYLQKKPTGRTVYILDEPTTGLHSYDVQRLISFFDVLVDNGETVIIIEHNLDVIKCADHIIDLGPLGGDRGGKIVATGTPEAVAKVPKSYTGQFLQKILKR